MPNIEDVNPIRVAIVILNWNGQELMSRYLPSVVEHSRGEGVKVFVADNGSTDGSVAYLRQNFPSVELLCLDQNYGFARGYNEALKQIVADYYILLNSDIEVTPDWVEPLISVMEKDRTVAAVQPKILSHAKPDYFEYAGAAGGFIDKLGFPFCRGRILDVVEKDLGQYNQPVNVFWASGACMAIRGGLFHKAGGFDSDFWAHMEEIDLCWRLKNMGFRIQYCPFSKVYHLGGGSLPYDSPRKLYLNFRNSLWMLFKNLPTTKLARVLFARMVVDGLAAAKLLAGGKFNGFASVVRAHYAFYTAIPTLYKKRKQAKKLGKFKWHNEMLFRSIIWKYYVLRRRTFNEAK